MSEKIEVLGGQGYIELIESMGGDAAIARSARRCYQSWANQTEDRDKNLVKKLITSQPRHGTTLRHSWMTFIVKAPLFVARQWQRHLKHHLHTDDGEYWFWSEPEQEVGSHIDEMSLRYVDMKKNWEFYIPEPERIKNYLEKARVEYKDFKEMWVADHMVQQKRYEHYRSKLRLPKELARCMLGPGTFTEWEWTLNTDALINWVYQRRAHGGAQNEHVEYAEAVWAAFEKINPVSAASVQFQGGIKS